MRIENRQLYLSQEEITALLNDMEIDAGDGRAEHTFGNVLVTVTADFYEKTCEGGSGTYMGMTMTETLHDFWYGPHNIEVYVEPIDEDTDCDEIAYSTLCDIEDTMDDIEWN